MMVIVVGVDGSEHAARAVEWSAKYAKLLDAEVVVVHAIDIPVYAGVGFGSAYIPMPAMTEAQRAELHEHVTEHWCTALTRDGVPFRVVCVDGYAANVIMEVAKKENADLVVTGRRGQGGFAELVLGSTSHQLAHHLARPLVIVP